jgi:hypothetical protein
MIMMFFFGAATQSVAINKLAKIRLFFMVTSL